tara:strand:+ start:1499 stop:1972 length:474 start_codon:yes stop_codon:yes gene_type:complete
MAQEKTFVIPLRKHWRKAPVYKRSKRALNALRKFIIKHMKTNDVKIGKELNELIFSRGFRTPPGKVQVTAVKDENVAKVNLVGVPYKEAKKQEEKKGVADKLKEKVGLGKAIEKPAEVEEKKETKKEEPKKEEKTKETKPKPEKPKKETKKKETKKK